MSHPVSSLNPDDDLGLWGAQTTKYEYVRTLAKVLQHGLAATLRNVVML